MVNYEVTVPNPKAGSAITLPAGMGLDVLWLRVRPGTSAAPVVQEADRTFQIVLDVGT